MLNLNNKVAVITGGANGLGKALAKELFSQGSNLALIDIDETALQKLKSELRSKSQKITTHFCDISSENFIIKVRDEILIEHGRIDILINNAAGSRSMIFDEIALLDFLNIINVNFLGTVYCTKHFLSDLKKQADSRIVNIVSTFALLGFPGKSAYASSKSAIMGFTNSLRTELYNSSIKVCLVIPPPLSTNIVKSGKHMNDADRKKEESYLNKNGMPLDKAAQKIISKVKAGKYRIVIGSIVRYLDIAARFFPSIIHAIIGKK